MKKTAPILLNAILMIVGCPSIIQHVNQRSETPMALKDKSSLKPIRTIEGITEYQLKNGLKVLLFKDDSQSTVTVNITYLVGSRHEGRGEAGMAHLLEHMLFKGTPRYPDTKGILQDKGAFFNATTWYDRTNYFETLPASPENLQFALEFEADRMINSWVRKADLDAEMTVVRNEFEMGENDPIGVLHDQIMSAAYQWHNYGKSTIGNRSDIERVPVENLQQFYRKYYQPDNAVLIVAGKFEDNFALQQIEKLFGTIAKPTRALELTYTEEPAQDGSREIKLMRSGDVACTGVAYHIPAGSHSDYAAVRILADVLTNEPGGYLYKALVESGEASEIFGMTYALAEPGTFMVFAKPTVAKNVYKVEEKMLAKLEKDRKDAVTQESVDRAKARILKNFKLTLSNSKELALKLSESIAQGGFELYFWNRDQIKNVTVADVKRVAKQYLIESNRTAGVFIPTKNSVRAQVPPTPNVAEMLKDYRGSETQVSGDNFDATVDNIEKSTKRTTLKSGIKLALLPKQTRGENVKAMLIFRFGTEKDLKGHSEALSLIPQVLSRGTKNRNYQDIQDKLDVLQSTMSVYGGTGVTVISITSDRSNILEVLDLAAEVMQQPKFDETEFAIVQKKELAGLEEGLTDPQTIGFNELSRLQNPWPKSSIHYVQTLEEKMKAVKKVRIEDLKNLYAEFYGASNLDASFVGSFEAKQIEASMQKNFGGWKSKSLICVSRNLILQQQMNLKLYQRLTSKWPLSRWGQIWNCETTILTMLLFALPIIFLVKV
jgi:zinc protease